MEKRLQLRLNIKGILCLLAMVLCAPSTVFSVEVPSRIIIEGDDVYVTDIFQNLDPEQAMPLQTIKVAGTPVHGRPLTLKPRQLALLAKRYRIPWAPLMNAQGTRIERAGRSVEKEDIIQKLSVLLPDQDSMKIQLQKTPKIYLNPGDDFTIENFKMNPQSHMFTAEAVYPHGKQGDSKKKRLYGKVLIITEMPTPNHLIHPGDIIQREDVSWISLPQNKVQAHHLRTLDKIVGHTPRRVLRPYKLFRSSDLKRPLAVKKGEVVPVEYKSPHMRLILKAEALQDGSVGDTISFRGYDKKKTISAKITAPNHAQIMS